MKKSFFISVIPQTTGGADHCYDYLLFDANLLMNNCIW